MSGPGRADGRDAAADGAEIEDRPALDTMAEGGTNGEAAPPRPADARRIILASLAAAVSSLVITVVASRVLDPDDNRQFLVFWAVLFGLFGVLAGIQHETTRAVGATVARNDQRRKRAEAVYSTQGSSPQPVTTRSPAVFSALPLGVLAAAVVALFSPWWAPARFPTHPAGSVTIIAVACVLYACHVALAGASAGRGRWSLYAGLMGWEAVIRLVLVGGAVLLSLGRPPVLAIEAMVAAAVLVWAAYLLFSREARITAAFEVDYRPAALLSRRLAAMFTAACTAVLITMYPVFIDAAAQGVAASTVAALLISLQLTRAPIMIPLQALQGVAIAAFVKQQEHPLRALGRPALMLMLIAVVGAALAAPIGPIALRLIRPGYHVAPLIWAGLVIAAGLIGVLTLCGTACLAVDRHRSYALGWLLAGVVGVAGLWFPGDLATRAVLALSIGPLLGIGVHLALLDRHGRAIAKASASTSSETRSTSA